jgi:DNA-binding winged helix-turn-helix (wHTH) protein
MATLSFGPFVMDLDTRRVRRGGTDLKLRPRAFQALRVLLLNSGQYVDYERMLAEGWDGTVVSPHTVGVTIGEVRKALGEYQGWITHRSKVGYRLEVPHTEDLIRHGWHFWNQHTRDGFEEALNCFHQAAAGTSGDFRAYEGAASCHLMLAALGMKPPIEMRPGFLDAHSRAMELSGGMTPELRCDAAHGLHIFDGRYAEAESAFLETRRQKPGLPSIYSRLAMLHYACGRLDAAMAAVRDGTTLDPLAPALAALETYVWLARRQFDVAVACGRRAVALHPHLQMAHSLYGQALEYSNQFDEALAQYRIASTISPDLSCLAALEGVCLARSGRRREALAILQRLDAQRRASYVDAYYVAVLLTALGMTDQALKEMERAGDECSSALHTINVDPHVDALRGNPGFEKLRARMQDRALTH